MNTPTLNLSFGPHVRDRWTTPHIMRIVYLSLVPAAAMGVWTHGLHALWIILLSVAAAVLTELIFDKISRKPDTWKDGSAVVTGLMLALTLSPSVPLHLPVLGSVFAILVAKCCFGGLGKNFINPALAGRCFLLVSFSGPMTEFAVDGVSAATPIAELMGGRAVNIAQMFLGQTNGVIGNSVLALLIGGLILWSLDIIHGQICFSVLAAFTLFMAIFGGQGFDPGYLAAHLCGGGVMLGAFFMATDYATSPVTRLGQTVFGVMIGVLGAVFRLYGSAADSFCYAILISNLFVPFIDLYVVSKPFSMRKRAKQLQQGIVLPPLYRRVPKAVVTLTVIALLSGLALSGVNWLTEPTIRAQKERAAWEAYRQVVPDAVSFEAAKEAEAYKGQSYGTDFGRVKLNEAIVGLGADNHPVGYAISVTSSDGYEGDVTLSVGISADGTIHSIAFTELNETPGKGMLAGEPEFKDQFQNRPAKPFEMVKGGAAAEDEISAISGATITSEAVSNAVNAAIDFYATVLKGAEK